MESQRQSSPPLCANGCGFFGSAATNGLCSKCYARYLKDHQPETGSSPSHRGEGRPGHEASSTAALASTSSSSSSSPADVAQRRARCGKCNKKTGPLAGFTCRCGLTFCGAHRYPEEHCCKFDYKAAGRFVVAKNNPLVQGDKMGNRI